MTFFTRQAQMRKGWGKEINAAWDEADHPRGKTTPESNDGSFAPKGGGGVKQAPAEQAAPGGKYDPNYVNQEDWTLSNKQPSPPEMREHNQKMGQHLRDMADNITGANEKAQAYLDKVRGEYGKDYAAQMNMRAVDEFMNPDKAAKTRAMDEAADRALGKSLPLGVGVKGTSYKVRDKVEVGAILSTSWGYDQTNTEFYEVVGASKSGKTVTIRELAKQTVENGFMSGYTRPVLGQYVNMAGNQSSMTKKVLSNNSLKIHGNYGYAHLWDGTDQSVSWGH